MCDLRGAMCDLTKLEVKTRRPRFADHTSHITSQIADRTSQIVYLSEGLDFRLSFSMIPGFCLESPCTPSSVPGENS
jgi:hypothetical protein